MPSRYDIGPAPDPVSKEVIDLLSACDTATIGHWRLWGFCDRRIQSLLPGKKIVGRAVTLAIPGPCSTLLHYAIDVLSPGDILVVDRLGDDRFACWGGGVTAAVKVAGAAGGIVDGPCTDLEEIEECDLPIWCRGLSPITTGKYDLGGRLNHPVSVGGVVVSSGDVLLCDSSGVLALPAAEAEAEARRALDIQKSGVRWRERILSGERMSEIHGARDLVTAAINRP